MAEVKLGCEAVDTITGWRGIVVGYSVELGAEERWQIQKRELTDDGETQEQWFPGGRISVIGYPEGFIRLDRRPIGFTPR